MSLTPARCLILACGNTLRRDDGIGLWLAEWAEKRFAEQADLRVIADHQWTPELADDVAHAESVLFIDCSIEAHPGSVRLRPVEPAAGSRILGTHHQNAAELLALGRELYSSLPVKSFLLTIGASSIELGEGFSEPMEAALPEACRLLEETVLEMLDGPEV
jgi:hydrogenase maturation protease